MQSKHFSNRQVFAYLYKIAKPFPWAICVLFLAAIFWALSLSVKPALLKLIINAANSDQNLWISLLWPVLLYLFMSLLVEVGWTLRGYFVFYKMMPQMRENITNHAIKCLTEQSHTYYQNNFAGSLSNKVSDLVRSVPELIEMLIDKFFGYVFALLIAIYTLGCVNLVFAIALSVWILCFVCLYFLIRHYLEHIASTWAERGAICSGKIVDLLSNILSVRLFSAGTYERKFIGQASHAAADSERKFHWTNFWIWLFYGASSIVLLGASLYFLIKGREKGAITAGDFALVLSINIAVIDFLWQLADRCLEFTKLFGRIAQALSTIIRPVEVKDVPGARKLIIKKGRITFNKVKFHYKGADPLFENKSVVIEQGQKVGLVGYSGSGKTTFVNLILRLYDVTDGSILIDGQNIQSVSQSSLRAAISIIPQDSSLFHRSLMENIRYGKLDATDEEVMKAAKKAHAHAFIKALPQGYHTFAGERGVKLSGGQRQRIAIARAILKNAPILILDEATSHLDSITESLIQESLHALMRNKTTIVIAHRLSTLLNMDRILVFDRGKIVGDGTHKHLMSTCDLYKTLWKAQVGGFLQDDQTKKFRAF